MDFLDRQVSLIGEDLTKKIANTKVAIFGLGGVGSYVFEMLLRNGMQNILVCDFDTVDVTNINRQLLAYNDTIGEKKALLAKKRAKRINENANIIAIDEKVTDENISEILHDFTPDYIIDCVDDVDAKIAIIMYAKQNNIHVVSSMGAGNRVKVSDIQVTDIYNTSYCPLAKKIRKILREKGIKKHMVVYSKEEPKKSIKIASIAEVPAAFGIQIASYIFNDIIGK